MRWQLYMGSSIRRLKMSWTLVPKRLKTRPAFLPILTVNSAFYFIARLRCQRSANGTQPHFAKWWTVNRATKLQYRKVGAVAPKNWGPKTFTFARFSTTSGLNGKYMLNETWHRQLGKGVGKCEGVPISSKNFMNFGPQTASNRTVVFTHPP